MSDPAEPKKPSRADLLARRIRSPGSTPPPDDGQALPHQAPNPPGAPPLPHQAPTPPGASPVPPPAAASAPAPGGRAARLAQQAAPPAPAPPEPARPAPAAPTAPVRPATPPPPPAPPPAPPAPMPAVVPAVAAPGSAAPAKAEPKPSKEETEKAAQKLEQANEEGEKAARRQLARSKRPKDAPEPTPQAPAPAPVQSKSTGVAEPSRSVDPKRPVQTDKAAASSGLKSMEAATAQAAIRKAVATDVVHKGTLKLPEFPPPAMERPPQLLEEEARRQAIREKETERRNALLLAATDENKKRRLEEEFAAEDKLHYQIDPDDEEIEVYPVNPPYAYVQIIKNKRTHAAIYHAIEPRLDHDEQLLLGFIEQTLVDVLDLQPSELDKEELGEYIRKKFDQVVFDYSIQMGDPSIEGSEAASKERLLYYVLRDFIGEGPLDPFTRDPWIEDVSCDGPHQPVFVYHRKYESLTTTVRYRDHNHLDSFVIRLAQRAGKHVSIAEPILDATMRDGSRLQATLAKEVSTFGSSFTIRKFREVPFTPIDLVRFGTMSSSMLSYLWMIIQGRQSAIYSGGTASGKTTAINAIMMFIPPAMKVITIEDTRELNIPQPNWIAGLTRGGFGPRDAHGRQAGEIDMFQLLKNALRQRPEYIIVGEVRGAEAYNLFQAMATGHAAYGTMHADSVDAVIHRLESDPINIPRSLLEALDVVAVQIQTRVGGKRVRRTKQITEIVGLDPNTREILTNEVFTWEPAGDVFNFSGVSYSLERIAAESGLTSEQILDEMEDRKKVIEWMVKMDIREYKLVAQIVTTYFFDKEKVLALVREGLPWKQ
jgi:type IV secretory pathway ATPase VirB11/archaellum biosynthesis ATPase